MSGMRRASTRAHPACCLLLACRRDARLAAREHLRTSLEQVALQGTELRLRPITHHAGQPTLPPALRVDPSGERRRGQGVLRACGSGSVVGWC